MLWGECMNYYDKALSYFIVIIHASIPFYLLLAIYCMLVEPCGSSFVSLSSFQIKVWPQKGLVRVGHDYRHVHGSPNQKVLGYFEGRDRLAYDVNFSFLPFYFCNVWAL